MESIQEQGTNSMKGALSGVKVVDFGHYIAGPYAAMLLAEKGAEVIKVEPPQGDPFRTHQGFIVWNRSKKGITLNIREPEGQRIAQELIRRSDVVIENFRPGIADKLGIGYDTVKKLNSRIIYCSISGFGQTGPYRDIPGWSPLVAAISGMYCQQGNKSNPVYSVLSLPDQYAAFMAAFSITLALYSREITGKGQSVDISLFNSMLAAQNDAMVTLGALGIGQQRFPWGPQGLMPLYRLYQGSDAKWFLLGCAQLSFFVKLAVLLGHEEWLADPLFEGAPLLIMPPRNAKAIIILRDIFSTKTRDEWVELLRSADIPVAPVRTIDEFLNDPQVMVNQMIAEVDQPGLGKVREMGVPVRMSLTPGKITGPAPSLGQHNREVLDGLRYPVQEITKLKSKENYLASGTQRRPIAFALDGIRVADFTTMVAGPGTTSLLSDMGADVVKIEPVDGDPWRSAYVCFMGINRGKRSIAIDLTKEEGRNVARKIVASSDIMIENMRPGVLKKFGLDYESVAKERPAIIYVSAPGYGSTGPYIKFPAFDPVMQALSGEMVAQGGRGNPPVYTKLAINDEAAFMLSAFGAALALVVRAKTGKGQHIENCLIDAAVAMQSGDFIQYKGMERKDLGGSDIKGSDATRRLYQCADGEWFFLFIGDEADWHNLCKTLGVENLLSDPRFSTPENRRDKDAALVQILSETFRLTSAAGWVLALQKVGIAAVLAKNIDDVLKDPHCLQNNLFVFQDDPVFGPSQVVGVMPKFSEMQGIVRRPTPAVGEHTDGILTELGYTEEQILELRAKKAVSSSPSVPFVVDGVAYGRG